MTLVLEITLNIKYSMNQLLCYKCTTTFTDAGNYSTCMQGIVIHDAVVQWL